MNSFEMNKIIGAILGTLLLVMGVGFLAEAIYAPIEGRGPGYNLPLPADNATADGGAATKPVAVPLAVLLASASADAGARVARKCQACHNLEQGAGNKVGPELYGVVGAAVAHRGDFNYSDALKQLGSEGTVWSYENLNTFLTSPKTFAPGTKMTFAGLRKETDRANILAYLQTLSASPLAFPVVENAAAATNTTTPAATDTTTPVAPNTTTPPASNTTTPAATDTTAPAATNTTPVVAETAQTETTEAPPADAGENAALYALIANASAENGARVSRKCRACHSLDEGGPNKVGPALYNIVGSPVAANETFRYSDGLKALGAEGKVWSFEMLDSWLTKPRDFVVGTKMTFGGLRKEEDRANLIAYLRTLSASPVPLTLQ